MRPDEGMKAALLAWVQAWDAKVASVVQPQARAIRVRH